MKMCVIQEHSDGEFTLPDRDDGTVPTAVATSDSSNSSSSNGDEPHKRHVFSWHVPRPRTTRTAPPPSRSSSHAVTHARTIVPKPPLPIQAARAMNCVTSSLHSKQQQQVETTVHHPHHAPPAKQRSSLKRSSTSSGEEKHVHFGDLEMRNYEIVLGDHPDCSSGPPVSEDSSSESLH